MIPIRTRNLLEIRSLVCGQLQACCRQIRGVCKHGGLMAQFAVGAFFLGFCVGTVITLACCIAMAADNIGRK